MEPARDQVNKAPDGEYGGPSMQTEATRLMILVKNGDRDAFDRLVLGLRARAFHVAHGLVGSRDDALELSQEAFLKTYRARATYRDGDPFLPWFHRILRNTCYTYLRKHGKIAKRSLTPGFGDDAREDSGEWELADLDGGAPADRIEADERAQAFWIAFKKLSARDREILSLRHFHDHSYQQIADSLGIPIGTVMSRLFHARRRLRDELVPFLGEDPLSDDSGAGGGRA
ncbi:MAG: RNA polymerase sigma factor [Planctomycetes bacterium]|nr:RNA polymerase sigma factor [Planctomycetota bacterium]